MSINKVERINNNLYFIGEITPESINDVLKEIHKLEKDKNNTTLNFYLSSGGGDVFEGLKLYDILNSTRLEVTIYISAFVGSAATFCLFTTRHKVVMYRNAILGFHELSHYSDHRFSNGTAAHKCSDKLMTKIVEIYNNRSSEITKEWLVVDKYLDAEEALEMRIIDEVI